MGAKALLFFYSPLGVRMCACVCLCVCVRTRAPLLLQEMKFEPPFLRSQPLDIWVWSPWEVLGTPSCQGANTYSQDHHHAWWLGRVLTCKMSLGRRGTHSRPPQWVSLQQGWHRIPVPESGVEGTALSSTALPGPG